MLTPEECSPDHEWYCNPDFVHGGPPLKCVRCDMTGDPCPECDGSGGFSVFPGEMYQSLRTGEYQVNTCKRAKMVKCFTCKGHGIIVPDTEMV